MCVSSTKSAYFARSVTLKLRVVVSCLAVGKILTLHFAPGTARKKGENLTIFVDGKVYGLGPAQHTVTMDRS